MIEEGSDCLVIAGQLNAVRKALDSTYARMAVCFVAQELGISTGARATPAHQQRMGDVMQGLQELLSKRA